MRYLLLVLLLVAACRSYKPVDACGNDPRCEPVTIGGSMVVGCRCYDHPVRQIQERP